METTLVNSRDLDVEIARANHVVIVEFWAPWCRPCRVIRPVLEALTNELGRHISVVTADVQQNPEMARQYNITSIPTLIIFSGGKPAARVNGMASELYLLNVVRPLLANLSHKMNQRKATTR